MNVKVLINNKKALAGSLILLLFAVLAFVGPWFCQDPQAYVGLPLEPPSAEHWLGTTGQGQDVLGQTVAGARGSLVVGFVTGLGVVVLSVLIGASAGYLGGAIGEALGLLINVFLIMPGLPLMVILAAFLPPGPGVIVGVLIFTGWAWNARVLRAQTLVLRQRDFVLAAEVSGESRSGIILREILPNLTGILASAFIGSTVHALGAQVGLEFLGLGDPSAITWGTNLYWASNDAALLTGSWWTLLPSGVSVALVGFSLVMINFAIDEVSNPRLKTDRAFLRLVPGARAGSATPVVRS